jgi:PelA/Pel-15E family pectate lyase
MLKTKKIKTTLAVLLTTLSMSMTFSLNAFAVDEANATIDEVIANQNPDGGWKKDYKETNGDWAKSTVDNKATYTEIRKLAKAYNETQDQVYYDACIKGINFLLNMQYENGGWPQVYQASGYHTNITYNDNAMVNVIKLLDEVSKQEGDFTFVDSDLASSCATAVTKGIDCLLKTQIVNSDGVKQAWCQQNDAETLLPASARAYELPSNSTSESVGIVRFLMSIENPSDEIKDSIRSAVAWLQSVQIDGIKVQKIDGNVTVIEDADAKPIWARFYDLETNKPFFCGRDGIKKDKFEDIEAERRNGYSWYGNWPATLLSNDYPEWEQKNAPTLETQNLDTDLDMDYSETNVE